MASNDKGFLNFLKEVKREFKRITWPSQEEVKKALTAVVVICTIYMVMIAVSDLLFENLLTNFLLNI
ncbi:MAG: preprotein translocase subunit SecE [Youngiibacter sp.]|jgi:preprotein translocase subunit SecE|uniref:Protein translocase subunit SecE n=1 Tax=Youngiibacter fragilis 232.1 TaxID=994573 RepID=V7I338_9CLOT|nr:preprotein translocase subunit SecE [Youngiibacter fragilis]ETA80293.1 preprotein translocase subunit SecE [Youngiibacter fragilis 232.1]MBW8381470.1 preprotein translocase subunit SecE [Youngiibacter sp.]